MNKKKFEQLLNEDQGLNQQVHGNNSQQKASKRPYGTYLRSADPEIFNLSYERYNRLGIIHISLFDPEETT